MPIIIQGATSGQATVQATDAATVTLTLPSTSGTLVTTAGGGSPTFTTVTATTGNITTVNSTTTATSNLTIGGTALGAGNASIMKNRIINGAMVIDQRNAGASVTNVAGAVYSVDRWKTYGSQASKFTAQQNAGSVTPPVGFVNYLGVTSSAATTIGASEQYWIGQNIEGYNVADLGWGTANAKTVTLSFWVRSSLTGQFGAVIANNGNFDRSYPFSYTISAANTWEQKSVTIAGDTSGTWLTNNSSGLNLQINLGIGSTFTGSGGAWTSSVIMTPTGSTNVLGTNGATFYITGVQLEVGSSATGFEYRQFGTELALCQRYFESNCNIGTAPANGVNVPDGYKYGLNTAGQLYLNQIKFQVSKRASPTITYYRAGQTATDGQWGVYNGAWTAVSATATDSSGMASFGVQTNTAGTSANVTYLMQGVWAASAEL